MQWTNKRVAVQLNTADSPGPFHFIPEPDNRCLTITLHAASVTPDPIGRSSSTHAASGGDYVLPVKDNQLCFLSDIAAAFVAPPAGLSPLRAARRAEIFDRASEPDKRHGRIERRTPEATTWLGGYLAAVRPDCRQAFRLERVRRIGGAVEVEVVFGINRLPRERADAEEWLRLTRAHWGIEIGLHGRRDGALCEDASRVRKGSAPQVMAILRNLVIYLRPDSGRESLVASTRFHMCHPERSVELLSTPIRR